MSKTQHFYSNSLPLLYLSHSIWWFFQWTTWRGRSRHQWSNISSTERMKKKQEKARKPLNLLSNGESCIYFPGISEVNILDLENFDQVLGITFLKGCSWRMDEEIESTDISSLQTADHPVVKWSVNNWEVSRSDINLFPGLRRWILAADGFQDCLSEEHSPLKVYMNIFAQ